MLAVAVTATMMLMPSGAEAKKTPKRIIALTPFSANVLADLGIRPRAVGEIPIGDGAANPYNAKIKRWIRAGKIRQLTLSHGNRGPNREVVTKLNPGLILSERTWRESTRYFRDVARIKVLEAEPVKTGQIGAKIKNIGKAVGKKKKAKKLAKKYTKRLKNVSNAKRKIKNRKRVLVLMGFGGDSHLLAFTGKSWGGNLVKRAGGRLLTSGLEKGDSSQLAISGGFVSISPEVVLQREPWALIVVPHGNPSEIASIKQSIRSNVTLQNTNAVRNGRLFFSTDNALLQSNTNTNKVVKRVRRWLKTW